MPPPNRTRFVLAGLGIWALIVLGLGSQNYATYAVKQEPITFAQTLLWAVNGWIGWLFLAPLVFYFARRFPVERPHVQGHLLYHAGLGVATTGAIGVCYYLMEKFTGQLWDSTLPGTKLALIYATKNFTFGMLVYCGIVAVSHGLEYYRRFKERELRATQLMAQLAKAELEVLKMQLQPHFLFNTLHAISALIRPDPDAADRIITRLGDLLRMSLQSNGTQEVTLRQELDFLEKYADIQRTRFRDRLTIRTEVPAETMDAIVPSLVLQPLVENSIRHGVERREQAAVISVRARRKGNRLELSVGDNGPGFPDDVLTPVPGRGLGLANTRARLMALYGSDGRLSVGTAPEGGALVTLDLPWRTGTHASA